MTDRQFEDTLDDILGGEAGIDPSPGFAAAVMRAVHREAATPPPLRFPWFIAIPGIFAWGFTLALVLAVPWYDAGAPARSAFHLRFWFELLLDSLKRFEAGWVVLALVLTALCVGVPLRLIRLRTPMWGRLEICGRLVIGLFR